MGYHYFTIVSADRVGDEPVVAAKPMGSSEEVQAAIRRLFPAESFPGSQFNYQANTQAAYRRIAETQGKAPEEEEELPDSPPRVSISVYLGNDLVSLGFDDTEQVKKIDCSIISTESAADAIAVLRTVEGWLIFDHQTDEFVR